METRERYRESLRLLKNYLRQQSEYGDSEFFLNMKNKEPSKKDLLSMLYKSIVNCKECGLYRTRKNIVLGEGDFNAPIVLIGEAPGRDEDEQGRPFVGAAGQLLTRILNAIKLKREEVYISNILKCRPPNNRTPQESEINSCMPFLTKQIEIIKPRIIVTLGAIATQTLLSSKEPMYTMRGRIFSYPSKKPVLNVVPTYHPAALLRNPNLKVKTWEDVKLVRKLYDNKEE